jgi:outer membrane protein
MMNRSIATLLVINTFAIWSPVTRGDNLQDIYQLALQSDPTIRAAEASYKAGLESENIGRSRLLPQINANGNVGTNTTDSDGEFPAGSITFPNDNKTDSDFSGWGANLDQAIVDMPSWFSFKQGKELTRESTAQFAADQQDLILRVADDYFGVLRSLDNLRASRAQETANQRQLDQTQQRFDVGLIAITDVHEAQAAYDLAVAQRLSDEGALGVALERLSVLTGQTHDNVWLLKPDYPVINPSPMDKDEWVKFAMNNSNLIKANAYARDAANENAKASKAQHYPKLSARLGYDSSSASNSRENRTDNLDTTTDYDADQTTMAARLDLTIPLYSGGFISASRRQAYQQYNNAMESYAGVVRTTVQTTRALHLQTVVDVATTKARQQAVVSSKSALDATQAGYEVGTRNIVDVLNVQQNQFSAIRDYANSRYDYVLDMLRLKNTAGLISPQDIVDLNSWLTPPAAPTLSETGLTP